MSTLDALFKEAGKTPFKKERPIVCVQGLGFVGIAMALAVANARNSKGEPIYNVIGVDLSTPEGKAKVDSLNAGLLPIASADPKMELAMQASNKAENLFATTNDDAYLFANFALVDIHFDVKFVGEKPTVAFDSLKKAIRTIALRAPKGCLIVVETTVPPGTCDRVLAPEIKSCLKERQLPEDSILLAHSYERVMPGAEYFDSIVNFWRVYAGHTAKAAEACGTFLSNIINTKEFPLSRLKSTTASEMGKILENSYRAMNIAFMEEWGRFAEAVNVDLFEVLTAIRKRPTHSNIRQPGFGVGGYCLTKDPLFAQVSAHEIFKMPELDFPFCKRAIVANNVMPLVSVTNLKRLLGGTLKDKRILLLGTSYREGAGDTRFSPSQIFVEAVLQEKAKVTCHDPLLDYWHEMKMKLDPKLPNPRDFDAIVFAVPHTEYRELDLTKWLGESTPLLFDANNVLTKNQLASIKQTKAPFWGIGRGESA